MNIKKFLTAALYSLQVPLGVFAGFQLGEGHYLIGGVVTVAMMFIEGCAVVTWMEAQTQELERKK